MWKKRFQCLLWFLVLSVTAYGQTDEELAHPPRTLRFLFLERPKSAPKKLHLYDGKATQEVELPKMNLSTVYKLSAGCKAIALLPKAISEGEIVPAGAPKVALPAKAKDLYLIVFSNPENKVAPVRINCINAGKHGFEKGQMLWFNLTDNMVGGKIASKGFSIKPRKSTVLTKVANKKGPVPVQMAYFKPGDSRQHPICRTTWFYNPKDRTVGFFFSRDGKRLPQVQNFLDFRIKKEASDE